MLMFKPMRTLALIAALGMFASLGAKAAVSLYNAPISGLTNNSPYSASNFLAAGSIGDLSWSWTELGRVRVDTPFQTNGGGPVLRLGPGNASNPPDGMTFNFTLAPNPGGYKVEFGHTFQGGEGPSGASISTNLGSLSFGNVSLLGASGGQPPPTINGMESFENVAAGDYVINLQRASGFLSLNFFAIAATPVVAAPVPEPEAFAMAALGLVVLGVTARRRRRAAA